MKTAQIKRLVRKLHVNPSARMHDRTLCDALKAQAESQKTESAEMHRGVLTTIMTNRATRLATAAVVIVLIGFVIVHQAARRQIDGQPFTDAAKSPGEMMTAMSLNIAYRKGGLEAVEKQGDRAFKMLRLQPTSISVRQLLEEFDSGEVERKEL
ncbi:MAG TPA: hypothetical protein VMX13_05895 [Sedimentisphaerales bacterium]|nr:hypothetical protein [Sedimentisphaerales bacterium]